MIPKNEEKILIKIDFAKRYLTLKSKFTDQGAEVPVFKKNAILGIFRELDYECKYLGQGYYENKKNYKEFTFQFLSKITRNVPLFYLNIFKDNKIIYNRESLLSYSLHYIPYDKKLINPNPKLNSLEELKEYLKGMLEIYEDFVAEYIKDMQG